MAKILITGASGGLGQALVKEFATPNNTLYLVARNKEKLQRLVQQYKGTCQHITYLIADLSQESIYDEICAFVDGQVDVVVHNAGYGLFQRAENFSSEMIEHIFAVNVLAPLNITQKLLTQFYTQQSGHIVFVSSQASKMVTPKSSVYSATKFALRGYANGLRLEAKKYGVHVMTVNPGPIDTAFFDISDKKGDYKQSVSSMMLTAQDVAKAIHQGIKKKKREINMPTWMEIASRFTVLFPTLAEYAIAKFGDKK